MTTQLNKNLATRIGLALAMTMAIYTTVQAQTAEPGKAKMSKEGQTMDHSKMKSDHMKEMMAEMKAQDAELTMQVTRMNSATREAKVDLMADILTKMMEQRTAMNARMEQMHGQMMKHMQMCMESKPHHPKMKGMEKKSEEMHKEHK